MAKNRSSYGAGKSSSGSGRSTSSSRSVSAARLHQKSGTTFGGYTKAQKSDGTFRMRPSGK